VCGCTENEACPGGCYWVEFDLCSQCHDFEAQAAQRFSEGFASQDSCMDLPGGYAERESGLIVPTEYETDSNK